MRNDFEKAAAHLLTFCPVAKRRAAGNKRGAAQISAVGSDGGSDSKVSIGKSGVHFRYYTDAEYRTLSSAQKKELALWRESDPTESAKQKKRKKSRKNRNVSSSTVVDLTDDEKTTSTKDIEALVASMVKKAVKKAKSNANVSSATVDVSDDDDKVIKPAAKASNTSDKKVTWDDKAVLSSILKNVKNAAATNKK